MIQIKHRFTGAVLCEFDVPDLRDAVVKAVADKVNLRGANLSGAYLSGAYLRGADLRGADLRGASLCGASLYGADLRGADLRGASLCGASLYGADLCGADLCGADLYGADLRGADLEGEKLAIAPIQIGGLIWMVTISESYMRIGCQRHTYDEWDGFTDEEIAEMADDASKFWKQNKQWLMAACTAHRIESIAYREANPVDESEVSNAAA